MSDEALQPSQEGFEVTNINESNLTEPNAPSTEIEDSTTTAEPTQRQPLDTNDRSPSGLNDRGDAESLLSHFSDSSSDYERSPATQESVEQQIPPSTTQPARTSSTWEAICSLRFGDMDDDDADINFRAAIGSLKPESKDDPDLARKMQAAVRIQDERNRGYEYDDRPKSPVMGYAGNDEDVYRQSVRWYFRLPRSPFDAMRSPSARANGASSPLRTAKSVDDLSPEPQGSPPRDEWLWFEEQGNPDEAEKDDLPQTGYTFDGYHSESSAGESNIKEANSIELGQLENPRPIPDPASVISPRLRISTSPTTLQKTETRPPPVEVGILPNEEDSNKDPPTPPSAEELEMMTDLSPTGGIEKLRETYQHLQSISFVDPSKTLEFKRHLIDYERRGLKYNGLDDTLLYECAGMKAQTAAHIYRRQREEFRNQADEQYQRRSQAERQLEENSYEISMLKHELQVREQKLEGKGKALVYKTKEAKIWQDAYEKFAPIAKREFDRKKLLEDGEEVVKDVETQTSGEEMMMLSEDLNGKHLQNENDKLTSESEMLRERNRILEERIAASDETWSFMTSAGVDPLKREEYIVGLQDDVAKFKSENTRLHTLLANLKDWQEQQELNAKSRRTSIVKSPTSPAHRLKTPTTLTPNVPPASPTIFTMLETPPEFRDLQKRMRNTDSWKRNHEAILKKITDEREAIRAEGERQHQEALRQLRARYAAVEL